MLCSLISFYKIQNRALVLFHALVFFNPDTFHIPETKWGGAKSFFSREGLFLLKMSGVGDAFMSSFGAIHEVKLNGESIIIDTGHMVAFAKGLDYSVKRVGGLTPFLPKNRE
ncbi:MAG: AIM24 family protein [Candidatus Methanoperedens sp.]|nr:AIM24 family protein [Candidatus Methanoperedens sp.]